MSILLPDIDKTLHKCFSVYIFILKMNLLLVLAMHNDNFVLLKTTWVYGSDNDSRKYTNTWEI